MSKDYSLLFHFENSEINILEIKINGIKSEDKSKIYHWLLFIKEKGLLFHLSFGKMGKIGEKDFRDFDDSRLEFDNEIALFTKGNKTSNLQRISIETELEDLLRKEIDRYINHLQGI
ncbi:MAG: hypothetical protein E6772_02835 [Dysgonomonas sp.]|nr:hypothetical protein [Dysgonomonas sp.]